MDKAQFKELMKSLKNIELKMDMLVKLLKVSAPKPKVTLEERKILRLCDKKHTIDDMMKETGKTRTNVRATLTHLRNKGLIESIKIEGKLVYRRIR